MDPMTGTDDAAAAKPASLRLAVASIKGGVGKTSTSVNLADASAAAGRSTVVWDLDPQGASTWSLAVGRRVPGGGRRLVTADDPLAGVATTEVAGLDVLPADFSLRHLDVELHEVGRPKKRIRRVLKALSSQYDTVIVDCPPGISLQIEAVLHGVDAVVVPVVPESLAMRTVDQLQAYIAAERKLSDVALLPFLSMVDRRRVNHRQLVDALQRASVDHRTEAPMLQTLVPVSVDVERVGVERRPVARFAPRSRAVKAYRELWGEILERTVGGSKPAAAPPSSGAKTRS
jgi:cellulose biosynthesis protein BcsQ